MKEPGTKFDWSPDKEAMEYQELRSWQKNGGLVTVNCALLPGLTSLSGRGGGGMGSSMP